jgi:hypothetical protein
MGKFSSESQHAISKASNIGKKAFERTRMSPRGGE